MDRKVKTMFTQEKKKLNVAVLGVTGMIGETMLDVLASRAFPVNKMYALASHRSKGEELYFKNQEVAVQDVSEFDFQQADIAFFCAGSECARQYAPIATKSGCIVIDKSSCFRSDPEIPLIVPEVNANAIAQFKHRKIIASPNCSTIPLAIVLKPIHDAVGVLRVNVSTYQSVSGTGKPGVQELLNQVSGLLNGRVVEKEIYPQQIGFNVLPQIDAFTDNGYTKEELKMHWETQKILEDNRMQINATAVRVPVFYGHSLSVNIETENKISLKEASLLLKQAPGIVLQEEQDYPTPVTHAMQTDAVYVGRLREDFTHPQAINLWVVADNTRKGAALNGVQIAELLLECI